MELNLSPETASRLQELAAKTVRAPGDLVEDAMAGYLQELAQVPENLDSRYDDLKNGRVKPVDGEQAFTDLRAKVRNGAPDAHKRWPDSSSIRRPIPISMKSWTA